MVAAVDLVLQAAAELGLPAEGLRLCGLTSLYLSEDWRGRGVGRQLLQAALSWAQGAGFGAMELSVWRRLVAARCVMQYSWATCWLLRP